MKIFIDTNIFHGLYESNNHNVSKIFEDISKFKNKLVFSEQVYDEFLRNRDQILQQQINLCNSNRVELHTTALINHLDEYEGLLSLKKQFKKANIELIEKLKKIKNDTSEDPVLQHFLSIYSDKKVQIFPRTQEIIERANTRMLIGNPPIEKRKSTIGDQVIWETLLENLNDDLIFVTEDKTYSNHKLFIETEYFTRNGKKVKIIDKVSVALKLIGETPSQELIEFEKTQKYKDFIEEDEVKDLLDHFKIVEIEISNEKLYNIFKASNDDYYKFMELIGVTSEIEERYRKPYRSIHPDYTLSRSIHADYITLYRKYFNPLYSPYKEDEMD